MGLHLRRACLDLLEWVGGDVAPVDDIATEVVALPVAAPDSDATSRTVLILAATGGAALVLVAVFVVRGELRDRS
jgi:hypothetical protein